MNPELVAGLLALFTLFAGGVWHLFGIRAINAVVESLKAGGNLSVLIAFWGLAVLHLSEIVAGAGVYYLATEEWALGTIEKGYGSSFVGLVYFSGVTFATLGYTQQDAMGPVRLIVMVQALAGFMLITWSATFVYSIWQKHFRDG